MKILIVDDDLISRKIMQLTCTRLGYNVVTAADGEEALKVLKKQPIQIIISDWVMPKMDGLELCEAARGAKEDSPFFFLITGRRKSLKDFATARESGVDDFIYKPVDPHVFRNQLKVAEKMVGLSN